MATAVIVGTLAGVAAWVLKSTIGYMCRFFTGFASTHHPNLYLLFLPVVGIMLAVAFQRWIAGRSLQHGTTIVAQALARQQYSLPVSLSYQPVIASILTLGFGGSAGAEGPVATVGAAIGSNIARLTGMSADTQRVMIGCGAGAGISGIFKSPIGGALYTLEVMKMPLTTITVLALIVASICGSVTCYILTGFTFDVQFLPKSFFDAHTIGWVILLGVFCGFYSVYYNKVSTMLVKFLTGIRNAWVRALVSGLCLGATLFMFPALYGEGYGVVTQLANGSLEEFIGGSLFQSEAHSVGIFILLAAGVMLLKVFAAIFTNSGGGVAGDFAPTIFAGGFCGLVFAWGVNQMFDAHLPVGLFVLYGTAGAFAGIIHAPLMATFLVSEMIGNGYGFFLPLAITATVSYLTVKIITPASRYIANNHDDIDALLHLFKKHSDKKE